MHAGSQVEGSFYSRYWCEGCLGVDAFRRAWAALSQGPGMDAEQRQYCFINGPFDQMGRIMKKIVEEECDGILIYPDWPKQWRATISKLVKAGVITFDVELPR